MLYTIDHHGRPRRGRIWHRSWPLRDAELLELDDTLVASMGIQVPDRPPVVFAADPLTVEAWTPGLA